MSRFPYAVVPAVLRQWRWSQEDRCLWYNGAGGFAAIVRDKDRKDGHHGSTLSAATKPDGSDMVSVSVSVGPDVDVDTSRLALRASALLGIVRTEDGSTPP